MKISNNSNQSAAPVVFAAPHKQQTAKEAIAANVQILIEQLEQGHSEGLTAYLSAMGCFHRYPFGNILEIARQKPTAADTGEKTLYVVDEGSLASTKQMHDFVMRLHPNDRVLLVGDTRQHEAVEAGRPFAQLQEAGMVTVKLEEIVRQRDPELKNVVEQLARGEVGEAVQGLERQGRVHEVKDPAQRLEAIAKEYAKSPENTLVVSPDKINARIHTELQAMGIVGREEHRIDTLVPRQDLTGADRTWAQRYERDNVLLYARS